MGPRLAEEVPPESLRPSESTAWSSAASTDPGGLRAGLWPPTAGTGGAGQRAGQGIRRLRCAPQFQDKVPHFSEPLFP